MDAVTTFAMQMAITIVAVTGVLGIIYLVGAALAAPRGKVLAFLTSSAPGERVLAYRACNACLSNAEPNAFASFVFDMMEVDEVADAAFALVQRMSGGLWVGGRIFLTTHRVVFVPNTLNRLVHNALPVVVLPLKAVSGVVERFGFITRIVDVAMPAGTLTVRGYKTTALVDAIRAAKLAAVV